MKHWALLPALLPILLCGLFFSPVTSYGAATSAIESSITNNYSKWAFSGFSLASVKGEDMQGGGASWFAYNYLSAHYYMGDDTRLAFRAPFTYRSAGFDDFNGNENQSQEVKFDDFLIDYTNFNVTLLPGEVEMYWNLRTSLPTSESSRDQKKIGEIRNEFIFTKGLAARWDLEYWPKFTWHIQTQTSYLNEFGTISNTKAYQLDHRLTVWYRAHQRVNLGWFFGGEDEWYNRSSVNDTSRGRNNRLSEHSLKTGPALRYGLTKRVNLIFNVTNIVPLWGFSEERTGKTSDVGTFKPKQTEFALLTFVSF